MDLPRAISTALLIAGCGLTVATAPAQSLRQERLVKRFDFDERAAGNLESIPMHWEPHRASGFPEFTRGRFDDAMGHPAPPAFYLPVDGRSCAYHYAGTDTIVDPASDYRVDAHVKVDRLQFARAFITAHYRDARGRTLTDTVRASALALGTGQWETLTVRLPGDIDAAHSIGVSVWVVQPNIWRAGPAPALHIEHRDVQGGAWFDDVLIFRMPRVTLSTTASASGHVFEPATVPTLLVRVADSSGQNAPVAVAVEDGAGTVVRHVEIQAGDGSLQRLPLRDLPAGFYVARLTMDLDAGMTIERELQFARLPALRSHGRSGTRLGLLLNDNPDDDWSGPAALVRHLGIRFVKVPLSLSAATGDAGVDSFVQDLVGAGIELAGVLAGATPTTSLIDRFTAPTAEWSGDLIQLVTRFEGLLTTWQLGVDGLEEALRDERFAATVEAVRHELSRVASAPILVAPWTAHHAPPAGLTADILSVQIPPNILPADIPAYLDSDLPNDRYEAVWALIETPPADRYRRLPALSDYAKRIVYAMQSSAQRVVVRQPWGRRQLGDAPIFEPNEEYLALRTLSMLLGDTHYVGVIDVGAGVSCMAFDRDGTSVLVVWKDDAPWEGEPHGLYLGGATTVADLWGRTTTLDDTSGVTPQIQLSPLPVLVYPAATWLVAFQQTLRFDPNMLPSEAVAQELDLVLNNPRNQPMSGTIRLRAPAGWRLRPSLVHFATQPGETMRRPIQVKSAPRETAGTKDIAAHVTLEAERVHEFEVNLPITLDLADVDVWADLRVDGQRLIIRHGVTNRGTTTMTFRSVVDAPFRRRQHLNIIGLAAGQSIVKQHVLPDAVELAGQTVRVGLKQIKGPRTHDLALEVP